MTAPCPDWCRTPGECAGASHPHHEAKGTWVTGHGKGRVAFAGLWQDAAEAPRIRIHAETGDNDHVDGWFDAQTARVVAALLDGVKLAGDRHALARELHASAAVLDAAEKAAEAEAG